MRLRHLLLTLLVGTAKASERPAGPAGAQGPTDTPGKTECLVLPARARRPVPCVLW
ncbi:MAG: hypothetical protein OEZ06_30910 [Myxococcales bacterium]|nr:hypothetical protein [Myxococcales bacterium]